MDFELCLLWAAKLPLCAPHSLLSRRARDRSTARRRVVVSLCVVARRPVALTRSVLSRLRSLVCGESDNSSPDLLASSPGNRERNNAPLRHGALEPSVKKLFRWRGRFRMSPTTICHLTTRRRGVTEETTPCQKRDRTCSAADLYSKPSVWAACCRGPLAIEQVTQSVRRSSRVWCSTLFPLLVTVAQRFRANFTFDCRNNNPSSPGSLSFCCGVLFTHAGPRKRKFVTSQSNNKRQKSREFWQKFAHDFRRNFNRAKGEQRRLCCCFRACFYSVILTMPLSESPSARVSSPSASLS